METASPIALAEELVSRFPGLRQVFAALAQRYEKSRRLPVTWTSTVDAQTLEGLRRMFSSRFVTPLEEGRVRVAIGRFLRTPGQREDELVALLFGVLGRHAGTVSGHERSLRDGLERGLAELASTAQTEPGRAFVAATLRELGAPGSAWVERAEREGTGPALELASNVLRCLNALPCVLEPVRIRNFSARALGSSKALRPRSELFRLLGAALVDHDPRARQAIEEQGVPPHRSTEVHAALELKGVYHDEAAASVLCFGPLVYEKRGQRFDHVARHTALGESSRLITHQLRDARFADPQARRVTVFENLTPYLDYVEACVSRQITDEVVLCSAGQASWAVVLVLKGLARFKLPFRHSGDLDRAGVMILRSLKYRSGAKLEPLLMDAATFARFARRGQPLSAEERRRLAQRIASDPPGATGAELLRAILASGVWVEQEVFAEECLEEMLRV